MGAIERDRRQARPGASATVATRTLVVSGCYALARMADEESTQPIDLEALRRAGAARPGEEEDDDDLASVTRLDVALPVALPHEDEGVTQTRVPLPAFEHPADELDDTRMRRMDAGDVREAFAAAEAAETTAIFAGPVPSMARAQDSASSIVEVDSSELESVPDVHDVEESDVEEVEEIEELDPAQTAEIAAAAAVAEPEPEPEPLTETRMRASSVSFEFKMDEAPEPLGDETSVSIQRPVPPPPAPWQPPAGVDRPFVPFHEVDADEGERELARDRRWNALIDLYRARMPSAETPSERVSLLHKIASVEEHGNEDDQRAFDVLLQAFDIRPQDEPLVESIDRVGRRAGRIGEVAERAKKNLHTADHELRVVLLGHLVFWYERMLSRGNETSPFVSELERLDKTHPVVLRRAAIVAASNADTKSQRELLQRALERSSRREEKVAILLTLAGAWAGTPESAKHYETAVSLDPSNVVALQGLERIGREAGKHAQVEWALERQSKVAQTGAERTDALLKLAELYETKYLKREAAAQIFERVREEEPAHPQALKGLERCYHALRDWPNLAKVLRARADVTYDKKQKVELLELAAEVYESKLGDPAAAVELHRDLLVVDPQHRRALGDLARLYEKLGDWPNVATYKARLAELAPTKRAASQQLVQLGDFLAYDDRDAISARLQYERAVTVDPTNAAAWEALQRMAAQAGDDRRVIQCLEQRAKNEGGPRQRGAVYVELANVHLSHGDERRAREAFEAAVKADPSNETAAAAMLDAFTREERWAEAAPLCELLVNVAVRDKDKEALFMRMRLQTRINAALGDADRAIASALSALETEPDDPGAQADLVAVCSQCADKPALVARAKEHLARIATGPTVLPADMLLRLAALQKDGGDLAAAARTLERALETGDAEDAEVLGMLSDVCFSRGDFARACQIKIDLARNATSAEARYKLLVDAGEILARHANELEKAAVVFEEARRIKALDHWLLHTLMWVYGELERWDALSSVLEGITQIQESPDRKVKSLVAMAQVVENKLHDLQRAADLYDQVLDVDRKKLDAFEELVRILTQAKDWDGLDRAYRKMIARVKDDDEPKLKFVLFQQLGLIYRDRLGDAERAFEALDAASRLQPDDTEVRKIVTELLVVTDNLDNAVARVRASIDRDPHDAELYAELYELFLRQHAFDKAWCAVNVLARLRDLEAEQARFHADYAPMPLSEIPGQLVEQAWQSHVLHGDLDPTLTRIFALITPAVARMRFAQLRPELRVGRPFTANHARMHDVIRATFANGAEILSLPPPELLLGDPKAPVPFAPALAPLGAILVTASLVEARAEALVYMVGKRLAEQRVELLPRAFFPSVTELTALLAAAVRVSRSEGAKDTAGAALDASLSDVLNPQERESLRHIVTHATMEGGLLDVKRWSHCADLSSMRAGLLLCGDVEPARRSILAEPQSPSDLTPREKIGELYKFATSDLYSDLRGAIGVRVDG